MANSICMYCKTIIKKNIDCEDDSHGICIPCYRKQMKKNNFKPSAFEELSFAFYDLKEVFFKMKKVKAFIKFLERVCEWLNKKLK